ncbi:MAG: UDP-N-acetylglucosamine--LPS N-acetylglucosamine transferase [Luteolibacter sp.]
MSNGKITLLALSSGGGHWVQLLRLRPAFEGCDVTFATVSESYRVDVGDAHFHVVPDGNIWSKMDLLRSAIGVWWLLVRLRPDVVVTTGAAPGYFAVRFGKWLGARSIWVDSVANADELSRSGRNAGPFADLWLTQWPELACESGPKYLGNVL